jgi:hypothetical protein
MLCIGRLQEVGEGEGECTDGDEDVESKSGVTMCSSYPRLLVSHGRDCPGACAGEWYCWWGAAWHILAIRSDLALAAEAVDVIIG